MPNVCVIILNYNGKDETIACLGSLLSQNIPPDTIIVCDNGSNDESIESLHKFAKAKNKSFFEPPPSSKMAEQPHSKEEVVLIKNDHNLGYARGNNIGIRYALEQNQYDYIWILNNDTTVSETALEQLINCAEFNPKAGILGSTIFYADHPETIQCAGGCTYNPLTTIFKPHLGDQGLKRIGEPIFKPKLDYIYGASLFIKTEVFKKCGLLNEDYFLFYEEIDFCKKALNAGYDIAWCKNSIVYHKVSQTVGQPDSGDKQKIAFANYHENLSTLIFTKKHYPWLLPATMLFRFFGKLAMLTNRHELYLIKPLIHAFRDFFMKRNQREHYRG